jgi:hypothetical protein
MVGFLVLVGVGIVTVLRPELEDEPNAAAPAEKTEIDVSSESERESQDHEPLQE